MTLASVELPAHLSRGPRIAGTMPEDTNPPADHSHDQPPQTPPAAKRRSRRRRRRRGGAKPVPVGTPAADQPAARSAKKGAAGRGRVHKEVSAGGVVYRRDGEEIEIVLASRRTRRGDLAWGLAKGGIEPGETKEETAIREVREETGLTAEIEDSLGDTKYFYVWEDARIRKTVHFFLMRHTGGDTSDRDDEMEEVRWFPLERALKRAAYRGERDVLKRAADRLR